MGTGHASGNRDSSMAGAFISNTSDAGVMVVFGGLSDVNQNDMFELTLEGDADRVSEELAKISAGKPSPDAKLYQGMITNAVEQIKNTYDEK